MVKLVIIRIAWYSASLTSYVASNSHLWHDLSVIRIPYVLTVTVRLNKLRTVKNTLIT